MDFGENLEFLYLDECPICLEDESMETMTSLSTCGHRLHPSCQKELIFSGSDKCPICRQVFVDDQTYFDHNYKSENMTILRYIYDFHELVNERLNEHRRQFESSMPGDRYPYYILVDN